MSAENKIVGEYDHVATYDSTKIQYGGSWMRR